MSSGIKLVWTRSNCATQLLRRDAEYLGPDSLAQACMWESGLGCGWGLLHPGAHAAVRCSIYVGLAGRGEQGCGGVRIGVWAELAHPGAHVALGFTLVWPAGVNRVHSLLPYTSSRDMPVMPSHASFWNRTSQSGVEVSTNKMPSEKPSSDFWKPATWSKFFCSAACYAQTHSRSSTACMAPVPICCGLPKLKLGLLSTH